MARKDQSRPEKAAQEETPRSISRFLPLVFIFFVSFAYIFLCEAGL